MQDVQAGQLPKPEHLSPTELERYSYLHGSPLPSGWGDAWVRMLYTPLAPTKNPNQLELFPET